MKSRFHDHAVYSDVHSEVERIVPLTIWLTGAAYEKARVLTDSLGPITDPLSGKPSRVTPEEFLAGILEMVFEHGLLDR